MKDLQINIKKFTNNEYQDVHFLICENVLCERQINNEDIFFSINKTNGILCAECGKDAAFNAIRKTVKENNNA